MVRGRDVSRVVDLSCRLPPDLVRELNITPVSHVSIIGDQALGDGIDVAPYDCRVFGCPVRVHDPQQL